MIDTNVILKGLENSPASVVVTDASGIIVYANKHTEISTQYSQQELIGSNPSILKSGIQSNDFYVKLWQTISSGKEWSGIFVNKNKSGQLYHERAVISPILNDTTNEIQYYIAIKEDITSKIETEEKLKENVQKYKLLFENQFEAYALSEIIFDENDNPIDSRFLEINKAFLKMTKTLDRNDIINKTVLEIWPNINKSWIETCGKVSTTQRNAKFENTAMGRTFLVNAYSSKYGQVATSFWDITDMKKVEENLKQLNSNKDKLFSVISHDLRGPFQGILGCINILIEHYNTMPPEDIKDMLEKLRQASRSSYELLDNLLYWSRLQRDIIKFNPIPINVHEFCSDIEKLNISTAKEHGLELINEVELDVVIDADENMLYSIFHNLVSNALKFTTPYGIISMFSEKTDYGTVILGVRDTGNGLSENDIYKILNTDESFTIKGVNKEVGSGLGLILVKEFIKYHNSKLNIKSNVGHGSEFSFEVKLF